MDSITLSRFVRLWIQAVPICVCALVLLVFASSRADAEILADNPAPADAEIAVPTTTNRMATAPSTAEKNSPWHVYLEGQGNGTHVELPKSKDLGSFGLFLPLTANDPGTGGTWGAGYSARVGLVLPQDKSFFGQNFRFEVGVDFLHADASKKKTSPASSVFGPGAATSEVPESEQSDLIICCFFGGQRSTKASLDYDSWQLDLLMRTDFGEEGSIRVSPFGGFTFQEVDRKETIRTRLIGPIFFSSSVGFSFASSIKSRVDTRYLGGALGTTVSIPLGTVAKLSLEGRADLLHYDAKLKVNRGFANGPTRKDEGFAARLGGTASVSMPVGPFEFALEGFANWLSWVGQVEHENFKVSGTSFRLVPEHLIDADSWQWGGGVRISIPLQLAFFH